MRGGQAKHGLKNNIQLYKDFSLTLDVVIGGGIVGIYQSPSLCCSSFLLSEKSCSRFRILPGFSEHFFVSFEYVQVRREREKRHAFDAEI